MIRSSLKTSALVLGTIGFLLPGAMLAADPSLPYRNMPGFECHVMNAKNECVSFSYFPTGLPTYYDQPSYFPSAPIYTPTYTTPVYTTPYVPTTPIVRPVISTRRTTVTVTGSPSRVRSGDTITYTIRVQNLDTFSKRIDVRAILDSDTTFVSATSSGDENDDEVNWDNLSLTSRQTKTLTLKVRVRSSVRNGDTLSMRVEADGNEDTVDTDVTSSRTSSANDDCYNSRTRSYSNCEDYSSGDIRVRATASPDSVEAGGMVTYTIRVDNFDSRTAYVDVNADWDDREQTFLSASDSGDDTRGGISWRNMSIAADSSRTFTLRLSTSRTNLDEGDTITLNVSAADDDDSVDVEIDRPRNF